MLLKAKTSLSNNSLNIKSCSVKARSQQTATHLYGKLNDSTIDAKHVNVLKYLADCRFLL
jgi:hypothetical protein